MTYTFTVMSMGGGGREMTGHNMSNETPLRRFACARKSEGVNIARSKVTTGSARAQAFKTTSQSASYQRSCRGLQLSSLILH